MTNQNKFICRYCSTRWGYNLVSLNSCITPKKTLLHTFQKYLNLKLVIVKKPQTFTWFIGNDRCIQLLLGLCYCCCRCWNSLQSAPTSLSAEKSFGAILASISLKPTEVELALLRSSITEASLVREPMRYPFM